MEHHFKRRLQSSFSRSASTYAAYAAVQKKAGKELISGILPHLSSLTKKRFYGERVQALDVGCGPQLFLHELLLLLPALHYFGLDISHEMLQEAEKKASPYSSFIQGDMENLPFSSGSFHLLLSSSAYQWGEREHFPWVREAERVLKTGGIFGFTMMISPTMESFYQAFKKVQKTDKPLHEYPDITLLQRELKQGFTSLEEKRIHLVERYENLKAFLKSIQKTGAVSPESSSFTLTPGKFRTLEEKLLNKEGFIDIDYFFTLHILAKKG